MYHEQYPVVVKFHSISPLSEKQSRGKIAFNYICNTNNPQSRLDHVSSNFSIARKMSDISSHENKKALQDLGCFPAFLFSCDDIHRHC